MAARLCPSAILAATGGLGLGSFFFGPAAADAAAAQPPAQPTHWGTGPTTWSASSAYLSSTYGTTFQWVAPPDAIHGSGSVPRRIVPGDLGPLAHLQYLELSGSAYGGVSMGMHFSSVEFDGLSYDADTAVTTGELVGIHATITGIANPCAASLSGSYDNATGQLTVDPDGNDTLNIETASSCGGLEAGQQASFNSTFTISPKVTITGS